MDDLSNYSLPATTDGYEPFFTRSMRLVLAALLLAAGIYLGVQLHGRLASPPSAPTPNVVAPISNVPPVVEQHRLGDLCANLAGVQSLLPVGLVIDGSGNCTPPRAAAGMPYTP
jgi:hypothetical protein